MGVRGITGLLKLSGWLHSTSTNCGCSTDIFRSKASSNPSSSPSPDHAHADAKGTGFGQMLLSFMKPIPAQAPAESTAEAATDAAATDALPSERSIPPGSTFWIDGNGLSFYLEAVAYARYVQQVLKDDPKLGRIVSDGSCLTTKALKHMTTAQINRLLPPMLPMHIVDDVVREFADILVQQCGITVKVVWDGPLRRPQKDATMDKRKTYIDDEWSALHHYCQHGAVPKAAKTTTCLCACWKSELPRARMTTTQVRHALRQSRVEQVVSEEEADLYLAQMAHNDPTAYVVGQDSDFFFFKGIQYVPMDTIAVTPFMPMPTAASATTETRGGFGFFGGSAPASNNNNNNKPRRQISACVFERSILATEVLQLSDEHHMIDLAYLAGNDYMDGLRDKVFSKKDYASPIDFLQQQESSFSVRPMIALSGSDELLAAMRFVEAWYDLHDLSEFPIESVEGNTLDDDDDDDDNSLDDDMEHDGIHVGFPPNFPGDLLAAEASDASLIAPIVRALQSYIDNNIDGHHGRPALITQGHLKVFQQQDKSPGDLNTPPAVEDLQAACLIESCIMAATRLRQNAVLAVVSPPHTIFDHNAFFAAMVQLRLRKEEAAAAAIQTQFEEEEYEEEEQEEPTPAAGEKKSFVLPIDAHETEIVDHIRDNRITIIHGETGCGKSSRLPIMLLRAPPPDADLPNIKLFISQPRRIAAKSLVERVRDCEPEFKDAFALRMGHGVREYETKKTRAWFVTTGYLTRLLANHPEKFKDCSHLIIDEVHERSVDTDILCLLCRRLMTTNKTIRLVLMSATIAASMYQEYFNIANPPIHVGVRRHPIKEHFIEDIARIGGLTNASKKATDTIVQECEKQKCKNPPNAQGMTRRYVLAAQLAAIVGKPGSSVLIFVPGMGDIVAITEEIEDLHITGRDFVCYPIHSDIPFEDQMLAFKAPENKKEVKIVIATNAAESSVTLPDVDHVICLGLCKQIVYNANSHRQMLTSCWISKASATQRAGRTGRVRPGNVYRLYTRKAFEQYFDAFEAGEMVRIPLDSVILMLKEMLQEEITPVLQGCIEPPDIGTIERSFQSLHKWDFLTEPNDDAEITRLGMFVSHAGVDLSLGSLIGLGIQFGVAAEAVAMVAAMSGVKTPFRMANALYMEPDDFNHITMKSYVAKSHFDANLCSDPFGLMNLMWDFNMARNKHAWCNTFSVQAQRMKQLAATHSSLVKRTANFLGINEERLQLQAPPVLMPHAKITLLRVLQAWVFAETMIECPTTDLKPQTDGTVTFTLRGDVINNELMSKVLSKRHPFKLRRDGNVTQNGSISSNQMRSGFWPTFEARILSYALECNIQTVFVLAPSAVYLYRCSAPGQDEAYKRFLEDFESKLNDATLGFKTSTLHATQNQGKVRGVGERKCGKWNVQEFDEESKAKDGDRTSTRIITKITCKEPEGLYMHDYDSDDEVDLLFATALLRDFLANHATEASLTWSFDPASQNAKKKAKDSKNHPFRISLQGVVSEIQNIDFIDILQTAAFTSKHRQSRQAQMSIVFEDVPVKPIEYTSKDKNMQATCYDIEASSWRRPLLKQLPEGARLLSVLASDRRSGNPRHRIEIMPPSKDQKHGSGQNGRYRGSGPNGGGGGGDDSMAESHKIIPDKSKTDLRERWRRVDNKEDVLITPNSIPASSFHGSQMLYGCCATSLELRGGRQSAECITVLPPGKLFPLLATMTFGVERELNVPAPITYSNLDHGYGYDCSSDESQSDGDGNHLDPDAKDEAKIACALQWLGNAPSSDMANLDPLQRIAMATAFNRSCMNMNEDLVCFPDKVEALCAIFDMVDGYHIQPWDDMSTTSLTPTNLKQWQGEYKRMRATGVRNANERSSPYATQPAETKHASASSSPNTSSANTASRWSENKQTLSHSIKQSMAPTNKIGAATSSVGSNADSSNSDVAKNGNADGNTPNNNIESTKKESNNSGNNKDDTKQAAAKTPKKATNDQDGSPTVLKKFDSSILPNPDRLFVTDLPPGEAVRADDLVSTNILSMVTRCYFNLSTGGMELESSQPRMANQTFEQRYLDVEHSKSWVIFTGHHKDKEGAGTKWYHARFHNPINPTRAVAGRGKNKLPKWIKLNRARPADPSHALECVPSSTREKIEQLLWLYIPGKFEGLVFSSLETAIKMEAAFWLEQYFAEAHVKGQVTHWYDMSPPKMIAIMKKEIHKSRSIAAHGASQADAQDQGKKKNKKKAPDANQADAQGQGKKKKNISEAKKKKNQEWWKKKKQQQQQKQQRKKEMQAKKPQQQQQEA